MWFSFFTGTVLFVVCFCGVYCQNAYPTYNTGYAGWSSGASNGNAPATTYGGNTGQSFGSGGLAAVSLLNNGMLTLLDNQGNSLNIGGLLAGGNGGGTGGVVGMNAGNTLGTLIVGGTSGNSGTNGNTGTGGTGGGGGTGGTGGTTGGSTPVVTVNAGTNGITVTDNAFGLQSAMAVVSPSMVSVGGTLPVAGGNTGTGMQTVNAQGVTITQTLPGNNPVNVFIPNPLGRR